MRTFVMLLGVMFLAIPPSQGAVFNGVDFPQGASSFADGVLRFDPLFSGGPAPWNAFPVTTLGPPNGEVYQSLGHGGILELVFADNYLTNDGSGAADFYVGEVIGTPEEFFAALRPTAGTLPLLDPAKDANGDGFFELGRFVAEWFNDSEGFVLLIDIDGLFGAPSAQTLTFDAIQFLDDASSGATTGNTVGFDLESVGAISSVASSKAYQRGDTDEDGDVDIVDLNNVRNTFGAKHGARKPLGDAWRYDNAVDVGDLNEVRNNFGARSPAIVPEASTYAISAALVTAWIGIGVGRRLAQRC